MRYVHPCSIVHDEEEEIATGRECYVVTFPDVRGANTGGQLAACQSSKMGLL